MALKGKCGVHCIAWVLMLIGALNWGLVGLFDLNVVNLVLGSVTWLERLVYILVGLSAIALLLDKKCTKCVIKQ